MREQDARRAAAFATQGYVVLDRFLDPGELADIRRAVEISLLKPTCLACSRPHNTLLPLRWNDPIVGIVLASTRRIQVLTERVGADDPKWISGYVSIKEARSLATAWHQDWWCWDHPVSYERAASQIAVLCYLTATNAHNGALRVLPGSHHRSLPLHALLPEPHSQTGEELDAGHAAMSDQANQVTFRLQAGDAVAIDYRLLHGTHGNRGEARRDCILLSFTPSWRTLPEDIRGHLISHCAQPGSDERPPERSWEAELLPQFAGVRRDLHITRRAPNRFAAQVQSNVRRIEAGEDRRIRRAAPCERIE